ncbi:MAG: hypothetical protein IT337_15190 [Thermomicrobiales bacterium]|nr:hypothetical protein [Thermomicrobiales bacterium]
MALNHLFYKQTQAAIGSPEETKATVADGNFSSIQLLKGILHKLISGVTVTFSGLKADDSAFTVGTDNVIPVGGTYKALRDALDDGDVGAPALTEKRALLVTPETAAGDALTYGAGAVAAGTPRVTHASDDPAVTALQVIDDWDESDRAKVNLIAGQAGVAGGAGAVGASVIRVTFASDAAAVTLAGNRVTLTSRSGTITSGGTAQDLAAANASRRGFAIQNLSTGDLYFNTEATAVAGQPSFKIAAGQLYETPIHAVPTGAVSIIGATTGQAFAAREW